MNNGFFDIHYQIPFLIPFERQLTKGEAECIARYVIDEQKEVLYDDWKSRKENKEWIGDVATRKEELFIAHNHQKLPILVSGRSIPEILKAYHEPNK